MHTYAYIVCVCVYPMCICIYYLVYLFTIYIYTCLLFLYVCIIHVFRGHIYIYIYTDKDVCVYIHKRVCVCVTPWPGRSPRHSPSAALRIFVNFLWPDGPKVGLPSPAQRTNPSGQGNLWSCFNHESYQWGVEQVGKLGFLRYATLCDCFGWHAFPVDFESKQVDNNHERFRCNVESWVLVGCMGASVPLLIAAFEWGISLFAFHRVWDI